MWQGDSAEYPVSLPIPKLSSGIQVLGLLTLSTFTPDVGLFEVVVLNVCQ